VCCSVLQCVAVRCIVLLWAANCLSRTWLHRVLQCVAAFCSVLQRVAVCCPQQQIACHAHDCIVSRTGLRRHEAPTIDCNTHCNTHCNTNTTPRCNAWVAATCCAQKKFVTNKLQHTPLRHTHCNTLTATRCNTQVAVAYGTVEILEANRHLHMGCALD